MLPARTWRRDRGSCSSIDSTPPPSPRASVPQRTIHYADDTMDRSAVRREDRDWLDERLQAPTTRFVAVASGRHPISDADTGTRRPCYLGANDVEGSLPGEPILLGMDAGGAAYFAVDVTDAPPSFPAGTTLRKLRDVITDLGHTDSAILACAGALVHWHRTHRFCGACGKSTTSVRGGHVRRCTGAACRREHFPRTDPAVITLVVDGCRCLLARRRDWSPGRRSTVAGFVEPGETLEHTVAREVFEEVGVRVGEVPLPRVTAVAVSAIVDARLPGDGRERRHHRRRRRDRGGRLVYPRTHPGRHRVRRAHPASVRLDQPPARERLARRRRADRALGSAGVSPARWTTGPPDAGRPCRACRNSRQPR